MGLSAHQSAKMHVCVTCKDLLDVTYFGAKNGPRRSSCKKCTNTINKASRERIKATDPEAAYSARTARYNKETRSRRTPEYERLLQRKTQLKLKYGLNQEDFSQLLKAQDGRCAICRTEEPVVRATGVLTITTKLATYVACFACTAILAWANLKTARTDWNLQSHT